MKDFFLRKLIAVIFLGFLALLGVAQAATDEIDVEYPVGTNLSGNDIFDENNIYPGWEESKTIRVENDSTTDDVNLYFTFDVNGDKFLAEELKLYVIRVSDGSYRIGGSGDRYTLESADDDRLYVDKLSATKGKEYRIKIKFDKDAGNEYQGKSAKFDIDFRIESEVAEGEEEGLTEGEILAAQGRGTFTGTGPEVEGQQETAPEVPEEGPSQTGTEAGPVVEGEKTDTCAGWPLWAWLLSLAVFAGLIGGDVRQNFKKNEYGWKVALALSGASVAFWWYFDNCREYRWFPYGTVVIAVLAHFVFLELLKRKLGDDDLPPLDGGDAGSQPPENPQNPDIPAT